MEFVQTFKNDNEKDFLINDPIYKHLLIFNTFYIKLFVLFSVPFCKFLILLSVFSDWLVLFLWLVVGITATHKHRHGSNLMYIYWSVCVCIECINRVPVGHCHRRADEQPPAFAGTRSSFVVSSICMHVSVCVPPAVAAVPSQTQAPVSCS